MSKGSALKLRIDWSELDLFGHVNNVAFFKYIQASRVNYWETIGLTQLHTDMKIGPMLAATSCRFLRPLFYPGQITVEAHVTFIKNSSFGIQHRIFNGAGEIAAEAEDIVVMFDFNAQEKMTVPENIRKIIETLEGRNF